MYQGDDIIFKVLLDDTRVTTTQVIVYLAIYRLFIERGFSNSVYISRREVMRIAKIKSFCTYHHSIAQLVSLKYIEYTPSYLPQKRTLVVLLTQGIV